MPRSLSDLKSIGCNFVCPVHISPVFWAISRYCRCKTVKLCPRAGEFSLRCFKPDRLLVSMGRTGGAELQRVMWQGYSVSSHRLSFFSSRTILAFYAVLPEATSACECNVNVFQSRSLMPETIWNHTHTRGAKAGDFRASLNRYEAPTKRAP